MPILLENLKVLLVEDKEDVQNEIVLHLNSFGCTNIEKTSKSKEALRLLKSKKPDCIILKYNMSDMSSFDFVTAVRSFNDLPILLITRVNRPRGLIEVSDAGVQNYVSYPMTADILKWKIRFIFSGRP